VGRKYVFKTKPRGYQVRALKKAVAKERLGLFMPMRSGKSKVAIDWACVMHMKHGIQRILIVTHSPTTFGVWRNEVKKHCPLPYSINIKDECVEVYDAPPRVEFWILNVQNMFSRQYTGNGREWEVVDNKQLYEWKPQAIIVDEATTLGDPQSAQSRKLYQLQRKLGVRYKLALTGTPAHRKIWGVFGIMKFLEDSVFGTSITSYRQTFGLWGGFTGKTLLKLRNLKLWRKKLEPWTYQLVRVPYREPIHQVIPVDLSAREWQLYNQMDRNSLLRVGDEVVEAPIILTRALKCAQLAAGWVKGKEDWHHVGTSMRDALQDHLEHLRESEVKRVVIYARHIPELRDAAKAAKSAGYRTLLLHGGVAYEAREQRIAAFHDPGGFKAFISQISAGSMGIDLSCADTAIYYTLTESLLHKDQADARIRVHGDKRALTYYYFIPYGTVLETMYKALRSNMNLVELIMKHPELVHRTEVG
jgi:superfamily II DNA or RNA helicase